MGADDPEPALIERWVGRNDIETGQMRRGAVLRAMRAPRYVETSFGLGRMVSEMLALYALAPD